MTRNATVNLNSHVARSEEVLASEVDGEVVMININQGAYSGLNNVGSEIWRLLESPMKVSDICDKMEGRYNVDRQACEKDVLTFLNDLASDNIIRVLD